MTKIEFQDKLGKRIKLIRKRRGLLQETVSVHIGVHKTTYSTIENGKTFLRADTLLKLCEILDCEPVHLFDFEDKLNRI